VNAGNMKFILFGEPLSKMRHRTSRGRSYDPQERAKSLVKNDLMYQVDKLSNSEKFFTSLYIFFLLNSNLLALSILQI
jgi:hypothetical protein